MFRRYHRAKAYVQQMALEQRKYIAHPQLLAPFSLAPQGLGQLAEHLQLFPHSSVLSTPTAYDLRSKEMVSVDPCEIGVLVGQQRVVHRSSALGLFLLVHATLADFCGGPRPGLHLQLHLCPSCSTLGGCQVVLWAVWLSRRARIVHVHCNRGMGIVSR